MDNSKKQYAIVSTGCIFPDAHNIDTFWNNICSGKVSIREIDSKRLDQAVYYRPEVYGKVDKDDKSYTKIGGSILDFKFEGKDFWIPPAIAKHMDDNQKAALLSAKQVFDQYSIEKYDKHRVGVIMGCSGYGELHHDFHRRFAFSRFQYKLQNNRHILEKLTATEKNKLLSELADQCIGDTFATSEDSAPGMLPNIIASRIANIFNIHGPTHTVDAACASGLAAITVAIQYLDNNLLDMALCGAADMAIKEAGYIYFSGINALSPDGSYPFDERANGFVIGQGAGVLLIKRLGDAIKDNDRILAVITGYGSVNDGKGKAIAAPNSKWQAQTITKACQMAGYSVDTIEMIEAHGTATKVGDLSEVNALKESFAHCGVSGINFCGLTSVKSNIGHLKSAAGIAGIIKAALAIDKKILPPIGGFQRENPKLELQNSPFYTIDAAREWAAKKHPRRSGVNAFGFGGVNYHIALQEYRPEDYDKARFFSAEFSRDTGKSEQSVDSLNKLEENQLFLVSSNSADGLSQELDKIEALAQRNGLHEAAENSFTKANASLNFRCGFNCKSLKELSDKIAIIHQTLRSPQNDLVLKKSGIFLQQGPSRAESQIAVMFPGQGSQYPDMLASLVKKYAIVRDIFNHGDNIYLKLKNQRISDLINSQTRGQNETATLLKNTENTHPAIYTSDFAMFQLLKSLGINPGYFIGHSAGEIVALAAAGCFSFSDGLRLMIQRASTFIDRSQDHGAMAAVSINQDDLTALLDKEKIDLYLANINSPSQIILSGKAEDIDRFISVCKNKSIKATLLEVTQAFHSPLVKLVQEAFKKVLTDFHFKDIHEKVICNEQSDYYSSKGASIKKALSTQITGSVQFMKSMEKLYHEGARIFIEVGPGSVLSSLAKDILADRDCLIFNIDHKKTDSAESFEDLMAALFSAGIEIETLPTKITTFQTEASLNSQISASDKKNRALAEEKRIVYSGVSIGLPGSYKDCFQDDNFEQLFRGQNCIERLSDSERQSLVDLNITKLVKSEQGASYQQLNSLNEVIQLAGKLGKLDTDQYQIDPKEAMVMSSAIAAAVAAGYEALRDAQIPLIHEYARTSSGALLPARWSLPQHMQEDTGVIFANGFPLVDPVIKEVSRHLSAKLHNMSKNNFLSFYDTLVRNVSDENSRQVLSDWYLKNHGKIDAGSSEEEIYQFNYTLMSQMASQANNRLAQFINARGPNFLIDAACSSTATAITLAEEMIKSGRVKRMIIIGADDTANQSVLPYIGAGFLSTGACSNEADLYKAAIPFDRRRNGMIMGSGAVAIVVEDLDQSRERGVEPIAELLGTHLFNAAGHQSQLDVSMYADQMERFISRIEMEKKIDRAAMAQSMIYLSHETYTPARGGCSQAEALSLKHVFGCNFEKIEISNTKGMTGHTMGASLEDAVAAKALQFGEIPPIVNHCESDPDLEGLKLSKGGSHDCQYALRLAAGFGAQGNFILLKRMARQNERFTDQKKYNLWLKKISKLETPELEYRGRVLSIKDTMPGVIELQRPKIDCLAKKQVTENIENRKTQPSLDTAKNLNNSETVKKVMTVISEISGYSTEMLDPSMELEADLGIDTVKQATILSRLEDIFGNEDDKKAVHLADYQTIEKIIDLFSQDISFKHDSVQARIETKAFNKVNHDQKRNKNIVYSVISNITGYEESILDEDMELEADLGIDTVKQATILSQLEEQLGKSDIQKDIRLSDYNTIGQIVELFESFTKENNSVSQAIERSFDHEKSQSPLIKDKVFSVISAITGYETSVLKEDMELEADLGIDTVKQATILSELSGELSGHFDSEMITMSDYDTIGKIITLFSDRIPGDKCQEQKSGKTDYERINTSGQTEDIVISVISEISGYPKDILEQDMELEADLGIDTVKQATILSMLEEQIGASDLSQKLQMPSITSIKDIMRLCKSTQLPDSEKPIPQLKENVTKSINTENNIEIKKFTALSQGYIKKPYEYDFITRIISANSDYPEELIADDLVLQSDYGFDLDQLSRFTDEINKLFDNPIEWFIDPLWTIGELKNYVNTIYPEGIKKKDTELKIGSKDFSRMVLKLVPAKEKKQTIEYRNENLLIIGEDKNLASGLIENFTSHFKNINYMQIDESSGFANILSEINGYEPSIILDMTSKYQAGLSIKEEQSLAQKQADMRYQIIQALHPHNRNIKKIMVMVYSDGAFGKNTLSSSRSWSPMAGFYSGFYKALGKEWATTDITIIDAGLLIKKQEELPEKLLSELSQTNEETEICWLKGKRMALTTEFSSFNQLMNKPELLLDYSDTIVVTGGASGITRELLLSLARHYKTNFAVIGRSALLDNAAELALLNDEELEKQKETIRLKMEKEKQRLTPVMIEREFQSLKKAVDIYQLINDLRSLDCGIVYYQGDISDPDKMEKIINSIRRDSGQITGIIHGAGIEISHFIEKKSLEEFRRVYCAKVLGAINLELLCSQDDLKLLLTFSSISGRFGNSAQIDYSAANEYLAFWIRKMSKNKKIHGINLISSGWDNTGMAFRNTFVKQYSAQQGIYLMDPQKAAKAVLYEIVKKSTENDVIIHKGLGPLWNKKSVELNNFHLPLIDRFEKEKGLFRNSYRNFSPKRDLFLDQHRISGTSLMPGVFYMEMMAEHIWAINNSKSSYIFRNLSFLNSFKFYREEYRQLEMKCTALKKDHWKFEVTSESPGLKRNENTIYATGEVELIKKHQTKQMNYFKNNDYSTKLVMDKLIKSTTANEKHVNFGPVFNDFKRETKEKGDSFVYYNENSAIMEFQFPKAQINNPGYPLDRFLINPAFLDSLHQAGAIYSILISNQQYLPVGAEEFGIIEKQTSPGLYRVFLELKKKEQDIICFNMDMLNPDNTLCYYIRNSMFRRMNQ
ncbi:MAG: SDR family NAD(P)-dependent oxidoreductase [Spirochaetales bacterium]|nr:SDR family NAD(P)-dependent oxidoreductase [Spirochaetales bacterium]